MLTALEFCHDLLRFHKEAPVVAIIEDILFVLWGAKEVDGQGCGVLSGLPWDVRLQADDLLVD